jgi:hypothetical protein
MAAITLPSSTNGILGRTGLAIAGLLALAFAISTPGTKNAGVPKRNETRIARRDGALRAAPGRNGRAGPQRVCPVAHPLRSVPRDREGGRGNGRSITLAERQLLCAAGRRAQLSVDQYRVDNTRPARAGRLTTSNRQSRLKSMFNNRLQSIIMDNLIDGAGMVQCELAG